MFTIQAKFYLFRHNICLHRIASRKKMDQEKRILAHEPLDVIYALIQQRLIECLLCAVSCVEYCKFSDEQNSVSALKQLEVGGKHR